MNVTYTPPAKVNLGLWILARRADGFHELATVFQEIPLCDKLIFEPGNHHEFICPAYPGPDNLAARAWSALESKVGRSLGGTLTLEKTIPAEAGLGGGSSDAAHTLRALNEAYDLRLPPSELVDLAATLGSDTAFFVEGGAAIGRGRGEDLQPITPYDGLLLLGVPSFGCATGAVYGALPDQLTPSDDTTSMVAESLAAGGRGDQLNHLITNDLAPPAMTVEPRLHSFLDTLSALGGGPAHLSGSGSSAFVLQDTPFDPPARFDGRLLALLDCGRQQTLWTVSP